MVLTKRDINESKSHIVAIHNLSRSTAAMQTSVIMSSPWVWSSAGSTVI